MSLDELKERIKSVAGLLQDKEVLRNELVEATTELYRTRNDCREGNATVCHRVATFIRERDRKRSRSVGIARSISALQ